MVSAMNPPPWTWRAGPRDGALGVALGPKVGWLPGRRRRERGGSTETELLGWKGREGERERSAVVVGPRT